MSQVTSANQGVRVDRELLKALLEAAHATALSHRELKTEFYSLGALEATANFVYILSQEEPVDKELQVFSQNAAVEALERFEYLNALKN